MSHQKRKTVIAAAVFSFTMISVCVLSSSQAYADGGRTMYFKEQSFAYLFPDVDRDYAAAVYGTGEAVKLADDTKVKMIGEKTGPLFYKTEHLGRTLYVPASMLTERKPKWTYRTEIVHKQLELKSGTKLYEQPSRKSCYLRCTDSCVYTLGETRWWYKIFYCGKVVFLRKNDTAVQSAGNAVFPNIQTVGMPEKEIPLLKKRVKYTYALLPQAARERIAEKLKCIYVVKKLPDKKFREKGAAAYACSNGNIYLREDMDSASSCTVEGSLLHELGHMLQYAGDEQFADLQILPSVPNENALELRDYYLQDREYLAETFEIYIKTPEYLKAQAGEAYLYFFHLLQ